MTIFSLVRGVLVQNIGDSWVAFSPASGDTLFVNVESAAILESIESVRGEDGELSALLAADSGLPASEVSARMNESWLQLIDAGLVRAD